MFPFDMLANTPGVDFQQFWDATVSGAGNFSVWHKPQGRSFAFILAVGGGSGGGGGATSNTGGGGGGGGGGVSTIIIPTFTLPDCLYILPGAGGAGGAAASAGASGVNTPLQRSRAAPGSMNAVLLVAKTQFATGGGAGGSSGGPAGARRTRRVDR